MITDAHLHLYDLAKVWPQAETAWKDPQTKMVTSLHNHKEWEHYRSSLAPYPWIRPSFGIHPQLPVWEEKDLLVKLAENREIVALGECGFDFYESRPAPLEKLQTEIFEFQLELALKVSLPLVIHLRRATDKVFSYVKSLKKLPAVIFHSWPAPLEEAQSLLRHGVRAFFSLGTPLLQGNKKALRCGALLPPETLLTETDAPYQTLKGETVTTTRHLELVFEKLREIRNVDASKLENQVAENFWRAYGF